MAPTARTFSQRSASRFVAPHRVADVPPSASDAAKHRSTPGRGGIWERRTDRSPGTPPRGGRYSGHFRRQQPNPGWNPAASGRPPGVQISFGFCGFSSGRVVSRDPRHCRRGCIHWRWTADVDGLLKQIRCAGTSRSTSGIQRCAVVDWPWPLVPRSQLWIKPCASPVAGSDVPI